MTLAERFLLAGVAAVCGLILGWMLRSWRRSTADLRIENELRSQIATRDAELAMLRQQLTEAVAARAVAEALGRTSASRQNSEPLAGGDSGEVPIRGIANETLGVRASGRASPHRGHKG